MCFLHGWGGSARYWESTARSLSDRFNCLLYALRGFGRSGGTAEGGSIESIGVNLNENLNYELESYAEDLATLLEVRAIETVYINAHSMGASIAVLFLNRYRDRDRVDRVFPTQRPHVIDFGRVRSDYSRCARDYMGTQIRGLKIQLLNP